jgi:hypothetical protein
MWTTLFGSKIDVFYVFANAQSPLWVDATHQYLQWNKAPADGVLWTLTKRLTDATSLQCLPNRVLAIRVALSGTLIVTESVPQQSLHVVFVGRALTDAVRIVAFHSGSGGEVPCREATNTTRRADGNVVTCTIDVCFLSRYR